jgi:spermidine/putrescine transport system ATP-binding protein
VDRAETPVSDQAPPSPSEGLPPAEAEPRSSFHDVRLERLTKRFDDVVAVDDISLEIERGHFFALLGPSGCGKTTTLRMIGGFEEPTAGRIYLGDKDVGKLPSYKRDVNTVFQSYALFPHLSIFENVAFGLRRRGIKSDELTKRTLEALELVGLAGLEKRRPRQLSGGQQQRIALARALVNRPRVLLLDEPLGALDLKLRKQMQLELKRIQHEVGITFIHVTHDQEEAMTMADQIVVMNHGRIEQIGTPEELYERPATAFVAGFLGVSNLLAGTVSGPETVRLTGGADIAVPKDILGGRTGAVAVGIRPEKVHLGASNRNQLEGTVSESAYIGVSTQYIVETPAGAITVYLQNERPGATALAAGQPVTLGWSPECTFVVDSPEAPE